MRSLAAQVVLPLAVLLAMTLNPPSSAPGYYAGTQPPFLMRSDGAYVHERKTAGLGVACAPPPA